MRSLIDNKDSNVAYCTRKMIEGESYTNSMLNGIEGIVNSHGGRILLKLPPEGSRTIQKIGGEVIVGYCDGITMRVAYNFRKEFQPFFWAEILTPREDWNSVPFVKALEDFFEIDSLEGVHELRKKYKV